MSHTNEKEGVGKGAYGGGGWEVGERERQTDIQTDI